MKWVPFTLVLTLVTSGGFAQTPQVTTAPRPPREPGLLVYVPPRREVPAWERALTHRDPDRTSPLGPRRWGLGAVIGTLVAGLCTALTLALLRDARVAATRPVKMPRMSLAPHPGVELRRISIALDWKFRAFVQHALAQSRTRTSPDTGAGRVALVASLRDALARSRVSLRAAYVASWTLAPSEVPTRVASLTQDIAQRDTVTAPMVVPPELAVQEANVVVTLVVLTDCALAPLPRRLDTPSLLEALDVLVLPRAEQMLHAEVLWSPTDEQTRRSPAEMTKYFPELSALG